MRFIMVSQTCMYISLNKDIDCLGEMGSSVLFPQTSLCVQITALPLGNIQRKKHTCMRLWILGISLFSLRLPRTLQFSLQKMDQEAGEQLTIYRLQILNFKH